MSTVAVTIPESPPAPPAEIVLLCAAEEELFARSLATELERARFPVALDVSARPASAEALKSARVLIVVATPGSAASPELSSRLAEGLRQKKRIVPVATQDAAGVRLPRAIQGLPVIAFRSGPQDSEAWQALIQAIASDLSVEAFICYARKDKDIADRLYEALARSGKRTWLDLRNIPALASWRTEIAAGIEAASNFLFVISPDSVASTECLGELEQAARLQKRLVPLAFRPADDKAVPAALQPIQRVDLQPSTFDRDFAALLAALETDLDYVRAHTRLTVRALEWERAERRPGLLPRGEELRQAEEWLTKPVPQRGPQPTTLQVEFVLAAGRAGKRRLWTLLIAASCALVFVAGLLVYSVQQTREKERQRRVAVSRALAIESEQQIGQRADLALLLAAESFSQSPTMESRDALQRALVFSPFLQTIDIGAQARIEEVSHSAQGGWLASAGDDGHLALWRNGAAVAGPRSFADGKTLNAVTFNPAGTLIAAADETGGIHVLETATWKEKCPVLSAQDGPVQSLAFHPQAHLLVAGQFVGTMRVWNLDTCRVAEELEHEARGPVYRVAVDPGGHWMASGHGSGDILLWKVSDHGLVLEGAFPLEHTAGAIDVAFSADGATLASAGLDGSVRLWKVGARLEPSVALAPEDKNVRVLAVAISPDNKWIAAGDSLGRIRVWDASWRIAAPPLLTAASARITTLSFAPSGASLVAGDADGFLLHFDLTSYPADAATQPFGHPLTGARGQITALAMTGDGATLLAGTLDGDLPRWAVGDGAGHANACLSFDEVRSIARSPDGRELAAAVNEKTVTRFTLPGCAKTGADVSIPAGETIMQLDYDRTGNGILAVSDKGILHRWALADGVDHPLTILGGDDPVVSAAASPDRQDIALGMSSSALVLAPVDGRAHPVTVPATGGGAIDAVAFSPDGKQLLTGGEDDTVRFRDVRTGAQVGASLIVPHRRIMSVAFGPGGLAASGDEKGGLTLWDVATHQSFPLLHGPDEGFVTALLFSDRGDQLISGDEHGHVIQWNIAPDNWARAACRIAHRVFTPDEARRYLGEGNEPLGCR